MKILQLYRSFEAGLAKDLAAEHRRRDRVVSMYHRRYEGRAFGRARAEALSLWAGLVLTVQAFPRYIQYAALLTLAWMLAGMIAPAGMLAALIPVRGRRPRRPRGKAAREIGRALDSVDASPIVNAIRSERAMGRPGYSPGVLWRAYLTSFIMGMSSTNELIRRLEDDPELRLVCGFGRKLPHRTTFNRFISRLARYPALVNGCLAGITDQLAELLPGLGEKVAVDSTTVRSHSNPKRKNRAGEISDPDASWTAKTTGSRAGGKKEYYWGYKFHLMVDATYEVPLYGFTTTASRNDSPLLLQLLDRARKCRDWMRPRYVMADKGYDALSNYKGVKQRGGRFIAPARRRRGGPSAEELAEEHERGEQAILRNPPTCIGFVAMEHVRTDPARGMLFRCRSEGCKARKLYPNSQLACRMEVWETPMERRLPGSFYEGTVRWKEMYILRQSVERVFKSLKESRRLERHCVRGLARMALHTAMSVLAFSTTYLVNLLAASSRPRWMVRKVA